MEASEIIKDVSGHRHTWHFKLVDGVEGCDTNGDDCPALPSNFDVNNRKKALKAEK